MIENQKTLTKVCGICYTDKDIDNIVSFCKKNNYKYYYILHYGTIENENIALDIDYTIYSNLENRINTDNKYHYHFCIYGGKNHRFVIDSIISDTLSNNLFMPLKNIGAYLRYMLHIDYDMKEHYIVPDIKSNDNYNNINELIEKADNENISYNDIVFMVMDLIENTEGDLNLKEVLKYLKDSHIDIKRDYLPLIIMLLKDKKGVLIK